MKTIYKKESFRYRTKLYNTPTPNGVDENIQFDNLKKTIDREQQMRTEEIDHQVIGSI